MTATPETSKSEKAEIQGLKAKLADREQRMRAAHRKISEMLRYEGLIVVDDDNGFAEIVMDGLSLGPPGGETEIGEPEP